MDVCGYGGWCARLKGHVGGHTRTPHPTTVESDRFAYEDRVLRALDWPAPHWADVLDDV